LAPVFSELAEKLRFHPSFLIAQVDATENQIPGVELKGYPTMKLFKKSGGKMEIIDYEGDRSIPAFLDFLTLHEQ
jgi:protein disulfide-isomerase A1